MLRRVKTRSSEPHFASRATARWASGRFEHPLSMMLPGRTRRSRVGRAFRNKAARSNRHEMHSAVVVRKLCVEDGKMQAGFGGGRDLVCRLLLEEKKMNIFGDCDDDGLRDRDATSDDLRLAVENEPRR